MSLVVLVVADHRRAVYGPFLTDLWTIPFRKSRKRAIEFSNKHNVYAWRLYGEWFVSNVKPSFRVQVIYIPPLLKAVA